MDSIASQITSLTIVYSAVYSAVDQRKHQSSASLAFVRGIHRGPVNSPHKGPVTRKMFPFDDVVMWKHLLGRWPFVRGTTRVTGGFPSQKPVTWLSNQSRRRWFETPSPPLWRHCNGTGRVWLHINIVASHQHEVYSCNAFMMLWELLYKTHLKIIVLRIRVSSYF